MKSISSDIVRVAIQANNQDILFKIQHSKPLQEVIEEICVQCDVNYEKDKFALQRLPVGGENNEFMYITDRNRYTIKDGYELKLVYSPPVLAKMIREKLQTKLSMEDLCWALNKSAECSSDATFSKEFFPAGYIALRDLLAESLLPNSLFHKALQTILNLIKARLLTTLDDDFLFQLRKIITSDQYINEEVVNVALEVLDAIVLISNDSGFLSAIVKIDELVHHIWSRDFPMVQSNALSLMNTMALKCMNAKDKKMLLQKMNSKPYKDNIYTNVISPNTNVPSYLAHVLYVYQSMILNLEKDRFKNVMPIETLLPEIIPYLQWIEPKPDDTSGLNLSGLNDNILPSTLNILEIRNPNKSTMKKRNPHSDSNERTNSTGFKHSNKKNDYISQLTCDCLFYFYRNHYGDYKIALVDEENDLGQFLQLCEKMVQIICKRILHIGEIPEQNETSYCPLVFLSGTSFLEELFSKAINLLQKTKREMKIRSGSDLEKVFQVVQKQLVKALYSQPLTFEQLDNVLGTLSYTAIKDQFEKELVEREQLIISNSLPIKQLRESLTEETKELIKKQRLQYIKNGTEFPVWNSARNQRVKNKSWMAFLTPNEKAIQYEKDGEVNQLMIQNISSMVTGKKCPHIKLSKSRETSGELSFSLLTEESSLDFIAPSQEVYDHWTDALNVLLGKEMKSISMRRDLSCLLEMEVRIRLLDLNITDIPNESPPIPLEPPNYDFCFTETK